MMYPHNENTDIYLTIHDRNCTLIYFYQPEFHPDNQVVEGGQSWGLVCRTECAIIWGSQ